MTQEISYGFEFRVPVFTRTQHIRHTVVIFRICHSFHITQCPVECFKVEPVTSSALQCIRYPAFIWWGPQVRHMPPAWVTVDKNGEKLGSFYRVVDCLCIKPPFFHWNGSLLFFQCLYEGWGAYKENFVTFRDKLFSPMEPAAWRITCLVDIKVKCEFWATGFGQEVRHVENSIGEISDFWVVAIENEHTLWT